MEQHKRFLLILLLIFSMIPIVFFISSLIDCEIGSTLLTGKVTQKYLDKNYQYKIVIIYQIEGYIEEATIIVQDENVWNLVEVGKTYQITYNIYSDGKFILDYIDITSVVTNTE